MKKKAFFTIPISLLLIAMIVTTFFLIQIKPTTKNVSQSQKLAEYTKSSVVRILDYAIVKWTVEPYDYRVASVLEQYGYETPLSGLGSGAIISSDGYIVTNGHVVGFSHQMSEQDIADSAFEQIVDAVATANNWTYDSTYDYMLTNTTYEIVEKGTKVYLPGIKDPHVADVKIYSAPIGQGKDVAILKIDGSNYPTIPLGNSDTVQDQDDIWVIGYPAAADSNVLSIDSMLVSTMNEGQISATSKTTEEGTPVIQINAAATHGNSGGPVIDKNGKIIGLLTFRGDTVNGQEVQGFNFAVPVNTVKEFVNQAGVHNTSSTTNRLFKEGLTFYWGGYYKDALEKFESVQRIYPNHTEVKRFISESEQKMDSSKTLWSNYSNTFYVVDGVAGLIIIILLVYTFAFNSKNKKSISKNNVTEQNAES